MTRSLSVLFLVFVLTVSALAGNQTFATIGGVVVDDQLVPINGVQLTLEQHAQVATRATTGADGLYSLRVPAAGDYTVRASKGGLSVARAIRVSRVAHFLNVPFVLTNAPLESATAGQGRGAGGVAVGRAFGVMPSPPAAPPPPAGVTVSGAAPVVGAGRGGGAYVGDRAHIGYQSRDRYARVEPNDFTLTTDEPLSTFGADVDTASYANVRRFLSEGQLPPVDAVRTEELLNYFHPEYAKPTGNNVLALHTEIGAAPWNDKHRLVLVGVKARAANATKPEGRNIVLLVDVSGSMAPNDRLPLLKTAFSLLVDTLDPADRLAIVTYAGSSGVHLESTPVRERTKILNAINTLGAGGSTNGAQGIITAYRVALDAYISGGVNRVVLATDGDFNVGVTRQDDLVSLIERQRRSGVFLSIFGVGRGNLNDATLESIANKGNGHYVYLDSLQEARRVMLKETESMLETVAKDVKFQVEFNPLAVAAWRLIGYENRLMAARDFNDDRKDGGELGAGHTVTMLYEIVPVGVTLPQGVGVDPLKYQPSAPPRIVEPSFLNVEWLTVKARFKLPDASESSVITQAVRDGRPHFLPFASVVAEFSELLRNEEYSDARWLALQRRAEASQVSISMAADKAGLIELIDTARGLARLRRH